MKKILVMLLVLALVLTTCTAAVAEDEDPYGKYEEPITISYLGKDNSKTTYDSTNASRKSPYENDWIDAYREYLNIDIERTVAEDDTALNALVSTLLASDDLPDIMLVPKSQFYVLAENGVLADLSQAFEQNAGPLVRQAVESFPGALETGMYDGEMLGFPLIQNVHNSQATVLWIRQDWLDALNLTAPKTMDELYEVAKAFKEAQFGGENTYGLGIGGINEGLMSGFGAVIGAWSPDENGAYVYANTTDKVKDGLTFMQKMYEEGLIRSDFAVSGSLNEDISNGLVGMLYGDVTLGVLAIQTCYNNDPTADWIAVRIPTVDGEPAAQRINRVVNYMLVVNKKCEHPEALFKILELELHMYYEPNDEERVKYNVCEDGYLMENLRLIRIFGMAGFNVMVCNYIVEGVSNGAETVDPIAQTQYENVKKGLAGDRSLKGRAYVYTDGYQLVRKLLEEGNLVAEYNGPTTENMTLYLDTINTALTNAMLKIVMGEDVASFDGAVAEWYANGGEAITAEINDYYSK